MKYFIGISILLVSGCSSAWVREGVASANHANATYTRAVFSKILPNPQDPVCLNIEGAQAQKLVTALNKKSYLLNFKECKDHALTLHFEPIESADKNSPSANGIRLKQAITKTAFGNSFWGFLLLSGLEITSNAPDSMHLTLLVDREKKNEETFSATWWNEEKQQDEYYLQQEIFDHITDSILKSIEPTLQQTYYDLHFKTPQAYFDDVIWSLNSSLNEQGLKDMRKLATEHPGDSEPFFNMGVLLESYRRYDEALKNYQTALSLPRGDTSEARDAVLRLQNQIEYIKKVQPLLPKYSFSDR